MKLGLKGYTFIIAIAILFVNELQAQSSGQKKSPLSIAVTNSLEFHFEKDGITKLAQLQKQVQLEFGARYSEIEQMQQKLELLSKEIPNLSGSAKEKKMNEAEDLQRNLATKSNSYTQQSQSRYSDLLKPLEIKIQAAIKEWCQQKGYDMIIDISKDDKGMIMWMDAETVPASTRDLIRYINSIL